MIGTDPPLGKPHIMDSRQGNMCWVTRVRKHGFLSGVAAVRESIVALPSAGQNDRSWQGNLSGESSNRTASLVAHDHIVRLRRAKCKPPHLNSKKRFKSINSITARDIRWYERGREASAPFHHDTLLGLLILRGRYAAACNGLSRGVAIHRPLYPLPAVLLTAALIKMDR